MLAWIWYTLGNSARKTTFMYIHISISISHSILIWLHCSLTLLLLHTYILHTCIHISTFFFSFFNIYIHKIANFYLFIYSVFCDLVGSTNWYIEVACGFFELVIINKIGWVWWLGVEINLICVPLITWNNSHYVFHKLSRPLFFSMWKNLPFWCLVSQ